MQCESILYLYKINTFINQYIDRCIDILIYQFLILKLKNSYNIKKIPCSNFS